MDFLSELSGQCQTPFQDGAVSDRYADCLGKAAKAGHEGRNSSRWPNEQTYHVRGVISACTASCLNRREKLVQELRQATSNIRSLQSFD